VPASVGPFAASRGIKFYCPHVGLVSDGDLVLQAVYEPEEKKVDKFKDQEQGR
jgi:fructose-1,6-bisphosphatase/inositol monophosphatase family enzyme